MKLTQEQLMQVLAKSGIARTPGYEIGYAPFAEEKGLLIEFYRLRDSHLFTVTLVETLGEQGASMVRQARFVATDRGVIMAWPGLDFWEGER